MVTNRITHVVKRSGKIVLFNEEKIAQALWWAMQAVEEGSRKEAEDVADLVVKNLNAQFSETAPSVEDVQDAVENALMERKYTKTAKGYILYRSERARLREQKAAVIGGKIDDLKLSLNSLKILERRYLLRDEEGNLIETPTEMFWRVANRIAMAQMRVNGDPRQAAKRYFGMMSRLEFLPGSPIMMNAGTGKQLSSAFAIPIEDSLEGIFKALQEGILIHKIGGGTGFSFSKLRARGAMVGGSAGAASGPIAFMKVFEAAMRTVRQSGRREGANMAVLRVDHPDILDFINLKIDGKTLTNFNTSVGITDEFMEALEQDTEYDLRSARTGKATGKISARIVFDSILAVAWRCGDPGILFLDRINAANSCAHIGQIDVTSACGEMPLLPYESCNEGSINLTACIKPSLKDKEHSYEMDWEKLRKLTRQAVEFLDDAIEINNYPLREVERMARGTRKIGLGIMGFADLLYLLRIAYDSEEAVDIASRIASVMYEEGDKMSCEIGKERGMFVFWKGSKHEQEGRRRRNSTIFAIAPTGTRSLIADVSPGIEPNYALAYTRTVTDSGEMLCINPIFEEMLRDADVSEETIRRIAKQGMIKESDELPENLRRVFVTAPQIHPQWHIRIQAAFQEHVDGAISKTINYPNSASVRDIEEGVLLAWHLGCKGLTVYRDASLEVQALNTGGEK